MNTPGNPFQNRPGKSSREVGDAPSIGHVPRMHKESESRAGRRSTRRSSRDTPPKAPNLQVITLAGAGLLAVAVLVIGIILWSSRKSSDAKLAVAPAAVGTAGSGMPASTHFVQAPAQAKLREMAAGFLDAKSVEEFAPLVRAADREPAAMFAELETILATEGKATRIRYLGPIDSRCVQLEGLVIDFERNRNRLALFAPDADGNWQVDFDAFARHVTPEWSGILSGEAGTATVRVFISADSYYNGVYGNDAEWGCFAMASPDTETLMFGYASRGGTSYETLTRVLSDTTGSGIGTSTRSGARRMTLEVRHDPGAGERQFEITRVLSDEWAVGNEPLDDKLSRPLSARTR